MLLHEKKEPRFLRNVVLCFMVNYCCVFLQLAKGQAQGLFMSEALSQMFFKYDLGSKLTEVRLMAWK